MFNKIPKSPPSTNQEAINELADKGCEPMEPYPGRTSLKWLVRCVVLTCRGHKEPFNVYMSAVRKVPKACKTCRERDRELARRLDFIRTGQVLPREYVKDARTPTRCWCMRCWAEVKPRLDNIRSGQGGCEQCGGKKRFTDEEARRLAIEWGYTPDPDIPYVNDANKWPGTCHAEGHYCEPLLNSRFRSGPCQACAEHGFKPTKPALLYIVTNVRLNAAKVGICGADPRNSRLSDLRREGWTTDKTIYFASGRDARAVEARVVRAWREAKMLPVLDNGGKYVGYTETVSLLELAVPDVERQIDEAIWEQVNSRGLTA